MRPRDSYKDRIYSTNVVGWEGVKFIPKNKKGEKDFSEIIQQALELGGFPEDQETQEILVGFGHHAVLGCAQQIVNAVKNNEIRHFFLIGGCDGSRPGRNYYTEFAKMVPKDCLILTLACARICRRALKIYDVPSIKRSWGSVLSLHHTHKPLYSLRIIMGEKQTFSSIQFLNLQHFFCCKHKIENIKVFFHPLFLNRL